MQTSERGYKILLVDDDPDFVVATKTVLEFRPGYKVLTASDASFGLSIARTERPI
jgi:DNA-binding response OmpR family regulator